MKSNGMFSSLTSHTKEFSKESAKDSFSRKTNRSMQLPKGYELETKDRVVFGLCNYNDIDKYFNDLHQDGNTKMSAVKKVADFTRNPVNKARSPKASLAKIGSQDSSVSSFMKTSLKAPTRVTRIQFV